MAGSRPSRAAAVGCSDRRTACPIGPPGPPSTLQGGGSQTLPWRTAVAIAALQRRLCGGQGLHVDDCLGSGFDGESGLLPRPDVGRHARRLSAALGNLIFIGGRADKRSPAAGKSAQ